MRRRLAAAVSWPCVLDRHSPPAVRDSDDSDERLDATRSTALTVTGDFGEEPTVEVDGLDVEQGRVRRRRSRATAPEVADDGAVALPLRASPTAATGEIQWPATTRTTAADRSSWPRTPRSSPTPSSGADDRQPRRARHAGHRAARRRRAPRRSGSSPTTTWSWSSTSSRRPSADRSTGPEGKAVDAAGRRPEGRRGGRRRHRAGLLRAAAEAARRSFEVIPLVKGEGAAVKEDDPHHGRLLRRGVGQGDEPFDDSYSQASPRRSSSTKGGLIDGWVKGLEGVKVGSRVMLVIPPELGYGEQGSPPDIPGGATLVFVIDVLGARLPDQGRMLTMSARKSERLHEPAHHPARLAWLRHQAAAPRGHPRLQGGGERRGLREDVRARQGRPPRARRADRGRRLRRRSSTTSRATASCASAFELPEIALEADEAAVIGLAARVWQQAGLASATSDALLKLQGGRGRGRPGGAQRRPAAARARRAVASRRSGRGSRPGGRCGSATGRQRPPSPTERHLEPWGIVSYRSRWYVVGHDLDRDDQRMFRLSRVVGDVALDRPGRVLHGARGHRHPGAGEPPRPGHHRAHGRRLRPAGPGAGAAAAGPTATVTAGEDGWDRLEIGVRPARALADEVLSYGPDVVVEAPEDLRAAVVERLRAVAGAGMSVPSARRTRPGQPAAGAGALPAGPRGRVSVEEAAREFGVPPATIRRDISVLMFCGLPGLGMGDLIEVDFDALEGEDVIRLSNADYLTRPLRLDSTEAAALVVGLRALLEGSAEDGARGVERALAKIEEAAGEAAGVAAHVDLRPPVDADEQAMGRRLDEAIAAGARCGSATGRRSATRSPRAMVDPIAVSHAGGHGYLDAWDHSVEDRRLFRLDRVVDGRGARRAGERARRRCSPRPRRRRLPAGAGRAAGDRCGCTAEARWVTRVLPGRVGHGGARRRPDRHPPGGRPGVAGAAAAAARRHRPGSWSRPTSPSGSGARAQRGFGPLPDVVDPSAYDGAVRP